MYNSSLARLRRSPAFLLLMALEVFWIVAAQAATTLTVTNLGDSGPGTLRDRIASSAPGDTIRFGVAGTVTLTSQLTISTNLIINGAGASVLKISGNNTSRVFNITGGSVQIFNLTIADGHVAGTNGPVGMNGQNVYGGGVFVASDARLTIENCVMINNFALGGQGGSQSQFGSAGNGGNGYGGALACLGSLTMNLCNVVSNTAAGGHGGSAPTGAPGVGGQGWGGGLYLEGSASIFAGTLHGNRAVAGSGLGGPGGGLGGGILNVADLAIYSSTIVSNSATGSSVDSGGAIENNGTVGVFDSTIVGNQADFGGGLNGGGTLANTILAGNSASSGPDGNGNFVSNDYNFIQSTSGMSFTGTTTHNIVGKSPLLGPLQNNGGPDIGFFTLLTMAPLPGSPVIDQGRNVSSVDQRGFPRPYDGSIGNAAGGNGADIGAIEIRPTTFVVINTNSSGAGSLPQAVSDNNGLGGGNTIVFTNNVTNTITLTLAGGLAVVAPVIIRGPGANVLAISANHLGRIFDIREPAEISGLTIRDALVTGTAGSQGQNGSDARGGAIYNQSTLTLSNCVVRSNSVVGGSGSERSSGTVGNGGKGFGGGVCNVTGFLFLNNCSFEGNSAVGGQGGNGLTGDGGSAGNGLGGAVCTLGGTSVVTVCSFINSLAMGGTGGGSTGGASGIGGQGWGAGLYSESSVTVFNSTISGGRAVGGTGGGGNGSGYGGGIYTVNDLALYSCTIASNNASGSSFDFGGGIYNVGATMGATNCTIAGNQADFGGGLDGNVTAGGTIFAGNTAGTGADVDGAINSVDYNLLQSFPGANISGATTHVIIGQDPLLGPLQDNGGPTFTMALLTGSPAIDKGKSFGFNTDQRGFPRPWNLPSVADAGGGDGSDIGAFEFLIAPRLDIRLASRTNAVLFWTTDAADFALQCVTSLSVTSNNWLNVNTPRVTVGNQIYVTNSTIGPIKFYRLSLHE